MPIIAIRMARPSQRCAIEVSVGACFVDVAAAWEARACS